MDGGIELRSDESGTTFRLSLPLGPFSHGMNALAEDLAAAGQPPLT